MVRPSPRVRGSSMDATTLLITVYCLIDDWLDGRRLRQRGPTPVLSDSEVLTIECVGEFFGIDTDKGLYEHFGRHYRDWFPALGRIHRTTFVRQAANLWAVKAQLRQQLLGQVHFDQQVSILDSFLMPVLPGLPLLAAGRPGRLRPRRGRQADVLWAPSASADLLARGDHRRPAGPGQPARPGHGRGAGGRGARLGTRRSGLLEPVSCRAPPQAGPGAPGATVAVGQGQPAAATEVGDAHQTTDRDRDRPADRALPRQTGLGPRRLAPVV